jgi:hypothetical protein
MFLLWTLFQHVGIFLLMLLQLFFLFSSGTKSRALVALDQQRLPSPWGGEENRAVGVQEGEEKSKIRFRKLRFRKIEVGKRIYL